ncbi:MAG: quinolinate synthase NadA, partial [Salinivirgaceae bacterium]|nr:quinolinate synthase NadA [Salinivirgaceae bacterium]
MQIQDVQAEIRRLKREKGVCVLAHAYQSHDIWEVADYVGDS